MAEPPLFHDRIATAQARRDPKVTPTRTSLPGRQAPSRAPLPQRLSDISLNSHSPPKRVVIVPVTPKSAPTPAVTSEARADMTPSPEAHAYDIIPDDEPVDFGQPLTPGATRAAPASEQSYGKPIQALSTQHAEAYETTVLSNRPAPPLPQGPTNVYGQRVARQGLPPLSSETEETQPQQKGPVNTYGQPVPAMGSRVKAYETVPTPTRPLLLQPKSPALGRPKRKPSTGGDTRPLSTTATVYPKVNTNTPYDGLITQAPDTTIATPDQSSQGASGRQAPQASVPHESEDSDTDSGEEGAYAGYTPMEFNPNGSSSNYTPMEFTPDEPQPTGSRATAPPRPPRSPRSDPQTVQPAYDHLPLSSKP
eukprot:m.76397 g.76397  ORF g.76397 m.76397 type:complete len:365 (+) comp14428_c0_seq1:140-1234(+)